MNEIDLKSIIEQHPDCVTNGAKLKGLCSIGRTKTKSGCAETDKSKLNKKRVIKLPEKVAAKRFKTE